MVYLKYPPKIFNKEVLTMKKLLAFLLALTLVLTLAACGSDPEPSGSTEPSNKTTAPTEPSGETTAPTDPSDETTAPTEEPTTGPQLVTAYALEKMTIAEMDASISFSYDDHGRMLEYEARTKDQLQMGCKMEYSQDGTPLRAITYGPEEEETNRTEYTSIVDGKWIERTETKDGVTVRIEMERSENGDPIAQKTYDQDGGLLSQIQYQYNDQGYLIAEITLDSGDAETERMEYQYNHAGQLSEYRWSIGDVLFFHYLFTYEDGRLVEQTSQTEYGLSRRYDYDEAGNISAATMDGVTMTFQYKEMTLSQEDADALEEAVDSFMEGMFLSM